MSPAKVDAFLHERQARIRDDTAQLDKIDTALPEQGEYLIQKAGFLGAPTAVMDQYLVAAVLLDKPGYLFLGFLTKYDFSGSVIDEIAHYFSVLSRLLSAFIVVLTPSSEVGTAREPLA